MTCCNENASGPKRADPNRTKYKYDGLGRRAYKTASGATTYFFFDPTGRMLSEVQSTAGTGRDYLFLGYEPIGRVDWQASEGDIGNTLLGDKLDPNVRLDWTAYSGATSTYLVRRRQLVEGERTFDGSTVIATVADPTRIHDDPVLGDSNGYEYRVSLGSVSESLYFGHADHLSTPIALTDGTGAVVWRAEHLPFGGIWSLSVGGTQNNVRFPGQYFDGETDLAQNWFRDYSARTGRYLQPDPLGVMPDTNLFSYVRQNPVRHGDSTGLIIQYSPSFIARYRSDAGLRFAFRAWKSTPSGQDQWRQMAYDSDTTYTVNVDRVFGESGVLEFEQGWGRTDPPFSTTMVGDALRDQLNEESVTVTTNREYMTECRGGAETPSSIIGTAENLFHEFLHALDIGSGQYLFREAAISRESLDGPTHGEYDPRVLRFRQELLNVLETMREVP